jgi:hypothetical protein
MVPDGKGGYKQGGLNFGDLFTGWWTSGNWWDWIVNILYYIALVIVIILIVILSAWLIVLVIRFARKFSWFMKIFSLPIKLGMIFKNMLPPSPFSTKSSKWIKRE